MVIRCLTFSAVVLAEIIVCPVMIFFPVRFIVFVVIAHKVIQSETVMAGNEVDATLRSFARLRVNVCTAADAACK